MALLVKAATDIFKRISRNNSQEFFLNDKESKSYICKWVIHSPWPSRLGKKLFTCFDILYRFQGSPVKRDKGLQGGERTRAVNKQGGGVTDFYFDVETKRVYSNAVI